MWNEFMQMSAPAGFVLASVCICLVMMVTVVQASYNWRRKQDQDQEIKRMAAADKARQIEVTKNPSNQLPAGRAPYAGSDHN